MKDLILYWVYANCLANVNYYLPLMIFENEKFRSFIKTLKDGILAPFHWSSFHYLAERIILGIIYEIFLLISWALSICVLFIPVNIVTSIENYMRLK